LGKYERTIELLPQSAQAHFRYGQALQEQKKYGAARGEYEKALGLDSKHMGAELGLAWLLATSPEAVLRDGKRAVTLAEQGRELAGSESPQLLDVLAAAYAEAGRFPEAVETARRALNLPATRNNPPLAGTIQSRLELYEAGTPCREKP
jgi:protein O-mannosyl-transferase